MTPSVLHSTVIKQGSGIVLAAISVAVVAAAVGGSYLWGRSAGVSATEAKYMEEKHQWELRVNTLQAEANQAQNEIVAKFAAKEKLFREEIDRLKKNKTVTVYLPIEKQVPKGVVDLHDAAVKGQPLIDTDRPDADQPSKYTNQQLAEVVVSNYISCNTYIDQLKSLQDVVRSYQQKQQELLQ